MDRLSRSPPTKASGAGSIATAIALILVVVGGLNWALVGLFNLDLVATLFGTMSVLSRIVYVVVGIAAVYTLSLIPRMSRFA